MKLTDILIDTWNSGKGYKTYALAVVGAIITFLYMANIIDKDPYEKLMGLIVSSGLYTIRDGIKSVEKQLEDK